jgi:hypothetical protein
MSKNLTRKGLAFGALVALGSSVVAGAPANAAPTALALASAYGTSTQTILGQSFSLAVSGAGLGASLTDEVELYIEGAVASDLNTVKNRKVTDLDKATSGASSVAFGTPLTATTVSATDKTANVAGLPTTTGNYTQFLLDLNTTNVTATRTIKVTAFVDNYIDNGKPDANETVKSSTIEITFNKGSEVTATTVHKAPTIGDTDGEQKAVVTLNKSINLEQMNSAIDSDLTSQVTVDFKVNGALTAYNSDLGSPVNADSPVSFVKTEAGLVASTKAAAYDTIAKNTVYSAQAKISGTASGTLATASVTEGATDVSSVLSTDNFLSATPDVNIRKAVSGGNVVPNSYGIRKGTTKVALSTSVIKKATSSSDATAISVGAGVPAIVTITANALATGSSFTAGGKTVDAAAGTASFATTTNADGKVAFDLTATGAEGDDATVKVEVLDGAAYQSTDNVNLSWVAAAANASAVLVDAVGTTSSSAKTSSLAVVTGGSYTLNFALYDDFGALYTGTDRYIQVTGGSVVKFVGGKASVVRTDSNVAAATNTLYYKVTSTDTVSAPTSGDYTVNVYAQTSLAAGFVTAANSGAPVPGTATFAAGDARSGAGFAAFDSTDAGTAAVVSGTVLSATGVALQGVPVTISGAGLLVVDGYENAADDKVWGVGSLTVITNSTGGYSVKVYSNKAGKQTVTVTSGSVSATTTPEWAAADAATASAITITAPTSTAPGTTAAIVVKLTDAKGNAVKTDGSTAVSFTVRVSGAGTPGTINEYTNADGETRFNVVVGSGETGSFKVTVTYDADKAGTTSAPITKEAVVTIAAAAAPVAVEPTSKIGTANSRVYVNVKDGKGSVVSVKIGAKWYTKTSLNNDYTFSFKAKAKSKVSVKVYVDGDLSSSKTIIVKK